MIQEDMVVDWWCFFPRSGNPGKWSFLTRQGEDGPLGSRRACRGQPAAGRYGRLAVGMW